jgi:hypothetical protein
MERKSHGNGKTTGRIVISIGRNGILAGQIGITAHRNGISEDQNEISVGQIVITTRRNVISVDRNKIPVSQNEISPGRNGIPSRQIAISMPRKGVSTNPQNFGPRSTPNDTKLEKAMLARSVSELGGRLQRPLQASLRLPFQTPSSIRFAND